MDMQQGSAPAPAKVSETAAPQNCQHEDVLNRIGQMTRSLHESLRGLGLDKLIEKTAHEIPNVMDRLNYVATLSEQAAQRVLNATDAAGPLQDQIDEKAKELAQDWQTALSASCSDDQYRQMADKTLGYLNEAQEVSQETKKYLLDIMMAQDFQDLTGQVIKRIIDLTRGVEQQLVQLLIDYAPQEIRRDAGSGLLNGPQIHPTGNPEVVADQEQVDDLLDSLGF
ncbi:MAG: cheZ [Burkholderiaceae bacterium]|nr:cheZ [Burkholderiaceae bacterium]